MVAPASLMSSRYFADSGCIQQPTLRVDGLPQIAIRHGAVTDQVDAAAQDLFQFFLEAKILFEGIQAVDVVEVDEEVEIAPSRIEFSAGGKNGKLQPPHAKARAEGVDFFPARFDFAV